MIIRSGETPSSLQHGSMAKPLRTFQIVWRIVLTTKCRFIMPLTLRYFLVATFFLLSPPVAKAQLLVPQWSFVGSLAVPQGDFSSHLGTAAYGLSIFGGVQVRSTPVTFGIEGSVYEYGRENFHVPISDAVPDISHRFTTVNQFITVHWVTRLQWRKELVKPYVEGLLGLKYFYTQTSLNGSYDYYTVPSTTNLGDIAFSYGVGGGLDVAAWRAFDVNIRIHAGVRYLLGGPTEYLTKGAIMRSGGDYAHKAIQSRTDVLLPTIGLSFAL